MDNKSVNNPSTEGKAPVKTVTTDTSATKATATTSDSAATKATAATDTTKATATEQNTATTTLTVDYLKGGYFRGEGKGRYTDPTLVGQAEIIGTALAQSGTPASAVKKMARTLKQAARLPYEAQQGALKKLTPLVLDLEHRKKAPALLREVVERNQAAVQNEADYRACLEHFQHITTYLISAQG